MTSQTEDLLRKVRGLIAKAASTEHPGEKLVFEQKASELMEKYAIETWMLQTGDEAKAKLIVRREFNMSWWADLKGIHMDARSPVFWLFNACVRQARCFTHQSTWNYGKSFIEVYGLPADLDYLDMLFTDLFVQLFGKLKPTYDPTKSLGENCYIAKEAGMSWEKIARWCGEADKVRSTEVYDYRTGNYKTKTSVDGKFVKAYKKHCADHGLERRVVHPDAWAISFVEAFYYQVIMRINEMNPVDHSRSAGNELVLRDIRKAAEMALYEEHPELRPHDEDCECPTCKQRREDSKKPVKYRQGHRTVGAAYAKGSDAGKNARIASRDPKLGGKKGIGS